MDRLAICALAGLIVFSTNMSRAIAESSKQAEDPKELKTERVPIGLEGVALEEIEADFKPTYKRLIIPPYYQQTANDRTLRLFFPFVFFRERTGRGAYRELGIFPTYWRHRSDKNKVDVVFPLYWRFRGPSFKTDIVLQTYYNRSDHGYNTGFAPLFFVGENEKEGTAYQVVPPLFWRFKKGDSSFLLAGIFYDKQKGEDYKFGLPPVFFAGKEGFKKYTVVLPPLFFRFENELSYSTKNILPPFFFNTREHGWSFGAMPLLYLARDKAWDKTLVLPFYYGSRWPSKDKQGDVNGEGRSHYFPLLLSYYRKAPGLSQGGAAIFYQWYWNQGDYMKMFSPLVWMFGNDRTDDNALMVPPLFYRRTSPVRTDTMVGLMYWNFHNHHRERTLSIMPLFAHNWNLYETHWRTWVAPTFDIGVQPSGYHVRMHPLFYLGKNKDKKHLVVAPLVFRFKDNEDDDLVLFPLYWRFRDLLHEDSSRILFPFWWQFDDPRRKNYARIVFPFFWDIRRGKKDNRFTLGFPLLWRYRDSQSTMTSVLNVVHNRGQVKGNRFWTFRMFPLIAFGRPPSPDGAYWAFLEGLVGWRRQGRSKQLKLFWIPINFKP